MQHIIFRKANETDARALYYLMKDTGYIRFYNNGNEKEVVPQIINDFFASEKKSVVIVCEMDCTKGKECINNKRIIGYSMYGSYSMYRKLTFPKDSGNYAYSRGTGVHSDFRNKGLGKKLRIYADMSSKKMGYNGMYTDVATDNKASLRVQEECGFKIIETVDDPKRAEGIKSVIFKKEF